MSSTPAPRNVQPGNVVIGNDGPWYTFDIRVGSQTQMYNVMVSTLLSQAWVVNPNGCPVSSPIGDCARRRGNLFDADNSINWDSLGTFSLGIEDTLLGRDNSRTGDFGRDTVVLADANGSGITVDESVVGAFSTTAFFTGMIGVAERPNNFSNVLYPSLLTSLKDGNQIPSKSFSYYAGAGYRNQAASLTFGGMDTSLFDVSNVQNFTMSQVNNGTRDLTVMMNSVSVNMDGTTTSLLDEGIPTFIDTTLPYIWIPRDECSKWEDAFGLEYNENTLLYEIPSDAHDNNIQRNPTITFTLADGFDNSKSVEINIPYESLALNFTSPTSRTQSTTRYFPLRQAGNNDQHVIGRAFFQDAYLSVNYEWQNFSISQISQEPLPGGRIAPLPAFSIEAANGEPPSGTGGNGGATGSGGNGGDSGGSGGGGGGGGFPNGAIAGIVIGVILIIGGIFAFWWFRRRRSKNRAVQPSPMPPTPNMAELGQQPQQSQGDYFYPPPGADMNKDEHRDANTPELPSPGLQHPHSHAGTPDNNDHQYAAELQGHDMAHEIGQRDPVVSATMRDGPEQSGMHSVIVDETQAGPSTQQTFYDSASNTSMYSSVRSTSIVNAGPARIVTHTRQASNNSGAMAMSPTAFGGVGHYGPTHSYHESSSHAESSAAAGLRRGGSGRSHTSEGTLVNNGTDGGPSPNMTATSPDPGAEHGPSAFTSPELTGLDRGFESQRGGGGGNIPNEPLNRP